MNRRVAVRALVIKDHTILGVRLKAAKLEGGKPTSYWCLPGGGVDEGEALLAALHREMIEETGVAPVIGNLLYVQQFIAGGAEHLEFFFHVTNNTDYETIDLAQTSHGLIEIAEAAFIDPTQNDVKPTFLQTEPLTADRPTQFFSFL